MVRPLRRAHFWIWIVLAIVLPAVLALAIAARHSPMPLNPSVSWEAYR